MSSGFTFIPYTSYATIELPIDLTLDIYNLMFEIDIELEYNIITGSTQGHTFVHEYDSNIKIDMQLLNFDKSISENIYKYGDPLSGTTSLKYKDLYYINMDSKVINIRINYKNNSLTRGNIKIKKFNYIVKDSVTEEYYSTYKNPEYMYSYNTSINGILENSEKNSVHIFLNEKYKNLLIIINENIPINIDWKSLNNIDIFGENYGLYYGKSSNNQYNIFPSDENLSNVYNPNNFVAYNYIKTINNINEIITFDTNLYYHYIDSDGNYASTQMTYFNNSSFNKLPNWINKFPNFLLKTTTSDEIKQYNIPYDATVCKTPNTNIRDKYIIHDNGTPIYDTLTSEPLGTVINTNTTDKINGYKYTINRFSGYYEPLTTNISMFKPTYYWKEDDKFKSFSGNYRFDVAVENFATVKELMYSKVNENEIVLKLKDVSEPSVYPLLDEVGLSQTSKNIFASPWDSDYYLRTTNEIVLYNNAETTHDEIENIYTYAQLINISISNNIINYHNNINIYGNNKRNTELLQYKFTVSNLSNKVNDFNYIIKYKSAYKTYTIVTGNTKNIDVNSSKDIIEIFNRPDEIKDTINYEEFTKWNIIIELYDNENNLLDYDNSIIFNVYNDLINLTISNVSGTNGFDLDDETRIPYYVNNEYLFSLDINENISKLSNIKYDYTILLQHRENSNIYDTLSSQTGLITNTKNIQTNITIPINNLDYNVNENRNIQFNIKHNYVIEDKNVSENYTVTKPIYISRIQKIPNLVWESYPSINMIQGGCNYTEKMYSGDSFKTSIVLGNIGGDFVGTVKIIFNVTENGNIIYSKSITNDLSLNENQTFEYTNVTLGPLKNNGEPIITYTSNNYAIVVTTSYIDSSRRSEYSIGFNDSTPNCKTTI